MKQIALSGIKPTGTLHIGNYLGMIKPAFDLIANYQTLYFVADYHALTTLRDKDTLNQNVYDVAVAVNRTCGEVLTVPEALIQESVMTIPGIDGRKMSKNYNNTIPIFADAKALHKQVMRIVTDSKRPADPKDPDACNVFNIFKYFALPEAVESRRNAYLNGGLAYSEIKQELYELLNEFFGGRRENYHQLMDDKDLLDRILNNGADRAKAMAEPVLESVRRAIGIRRQ